MHVFAHDSFMDTLMGTTIVEAILHPRHTMSLLHSVQISIQTQQHEEICCTIANSKKEPAIHDCVHICIPFKLIKFSQEVNVVKFI